MREDLVWVMSVAPFAANAELAFGWFVEGVPGRSDGEKITNSVAWAQDYQGGRYLPDILIGAARYFHRRANYSGAIGLVDRYLEQYKEAGDRLLILKAMCLSQRNDGQGARAVLDLVEKGYADSGLVPQVAFLRGWTYLNEQKTSEARTAFEELVARYPKDAFSEKAKRILESLKK